MGNNSTTTHVANAYHEDIWVMLSGDIQYTKLESFEGSGSVSFKGVEAKTSGGVYECLYVSIT